MAHKNRERRAAKKMRAAEKSQVVYDESYADTDEDYYYEDGDEDYAPRRRRGPHPVLVALIITAAVVFGGFFTLEKLYGNAVDPVEPGNTEGIEIDIPEGATTTTIASILAENDLIGSEFFFKLHCKRMEYDGKFKPGSFTFNKNMNADEMAAALIAGSALADTRNFTVPEGYNITQIANLLEKEGIVSAAEFREEVANGEYDYAFLEACPEGEERLEGFLYPNTYNVYTDATAHDVVSIMLAEFAMRFKDEYYARAQEMGKSVRDIVNMGSIVERESVVAAERPMMAGVFYNRLEQGMRLESCATIQYILGEPKEFLTNADTQIESPYNTYLNDGLPPGPICNPRIESIEAALYPDDNDYVFFVLSDALDGSHKFSADYNEFLANKDAYYAKVDD